jgi:two-component system sensor histidine kinase TctE
MQFVDWATDSMNPPPERATAIRRRLLTLLILPVSVALLIGTVGDYLSSIRPIRDAYDQALGDAALALALNIQIDAQQHINARVPSEALTLLRTDLSDSIYFRISSPDHQVLAGDADLPDAPAGAGNPSHQTVTFRDKPTRLATYRDLTRAGTVVITVAETLNKRTRVREQIWSTALIVDLLELATLLAFVWIAVRLSLKPLQSLGDELAMRSPTDLKPLPTKTVPLEVLPMVERLNALLGTLSECSQAERQFLESAAHQLRTPLAGMLAQLELMLAEEQDQSKRDRLTLTLESARRLSHTTHQLLTLARSEHGTYAFAASRHIDLTALATTAIAQHLTRASKAGIDLGAELEPASVQGIAWLLAEALSNLLDNAITYTPPGGAITVRTGSLDARPYLEVVDNGSGIPAGERAHVLERFYRGQQSRGSGSGLGLAIVADVARRHGAALSIQDGAEGHGTRVRLLFPARPPATQGG